MPEMKRKMKILFLCTGNSCRSQMAEGFTRVLKGDLFEPFSAGVAARGVDLRAVRAMAEADVDISSQTSKDLKQITDRSFDYVVTVCNKAKESCPVFPGRTKLIHKGFDDPPDLAAGASSEEEAMSHYRRVRDEIRAFIEGMPEVLEAPGREASKSTAEAIKGFLTSIDLKGEQK
ncbi:MAG: arsenate reductase ArsC [Thermodesulfobacteriota bacterium]